MNSNASKLFFVAVILGFLNLTVAGEPTVGKPCVSRSPSIKFNMHSARLPVAYARFGDCGYGCFLGHSFGSRRLPKSQSLTMMGQCGRNGTSAGGISAVVETNYHCFSQLRLDFSPGEYRLWRISLEAPMNSERAETFSRIVRDDLSSTFGLPREVWHATSLGARSDISAEVPGGIRIRIRRNPEMSRGFLLQVELSNGRVLSRAPEDGDVEVEVEGL